MYNYKQDEKSIISKIIKAIEFRGYMTEKELYELGEVEGIKYDTVKRNLRKMTGFLENGDRHEYYCEFIQPDKDERGILKGYKWVKEGNKSLNEKVGDNWKPPKKPKDLCCWSFKLLGQHATDGSCSFNPLKERQTTLKI